MSDAILEVRDLAVRFGGSATGVHAVRGTSFDVRPGEVLGIVGESGSGKSASALAIMGLLPPSAHVSGSVRLAGQQLLGLDDAGLSRVRGNTIAMVFQDPLSALTPVYTVGDQIAEAIHAHRDVTKDEARKRTLELLDLVGIPNAAARAGAFPHEFSGGMRQRVMIAMAIANDPDVIVADEPTTALDVTVQAQVLEVLRTARDVTGAAILMITHDLSLIAGFADRLAVMYAGRIVETGSVDDAFYTTRMPYTVGLLGAIPRADESGTQPLVPIAGSPPSLAGLAPGCPFAPRCPVAIDVCRETEPALELVGDGAQRAACHRSGEVGASLPVAEIFPLPQLPPPAFTAGPREERPIVLQLDALVKHHPLTKGAVFKRRVGTVRAVDGISFDIRDGETFGLVGESGCGKSTTLLEILELTAPQDGRIVVLGSDTSGLGKAERQQLRRRMSVVFQDPLASLDPRMPVSDILAEPLRTHGVAKGATASRVRELLELVGLESGHAGRYPLQFSGGQRQRIAIARALALEPKLLVLDEPVSALDVSIQAGVINLLEALSRRLGLAYLFVAHDLSVVRHIADRVAVMYLGRIVEIGEITSVYDRPVHPYTQALLSAVPLPDPRKERARTRILLSGDQPSPTDVPSGCRFRSRCPLFAQLDDAAQRPCVETDPGLEGAGDDHRAACHHARVVQVV